MNFQMKDRISRVLLINPPYSHGTYLNIDRRAGTMRNPLLSLASIAGALSDLAEVEILDLDIEKHPTQVLATKVASFKPELVGITATTPLFSSLVKISQTVKTIDKSIIVVVGGVHATSFPEETLQYESVDMVAVGEGDFTLRDLLSSEDVASVKGIYFRNRNDANEKVVFTGERDLLADLDLLPFPRWELYDIPRYRASKLIERYSPGGMIETSRGCPFHCNFCNKSIFGRVWRKKSVARVVAEFERMKSVGFREIHVEDDGFSTDIARAKEICREIINRNLGIPWTLVNGIRVDRADKDLFELLKRSGCYQVAFGIESGDEAVLRSVGKGVTLQEIEDAVILAADVGLETFGFFLFGLKGETEKSMEKTVEFAKKLPLTIAKFAITVPLPGTPYYDELEKDGRILVHGWDHYLCHNNKQQLFEHPNVSWKAIQHYYKKAYRDFYLRPSQIGMHLKMAVRTGTLMEKAAYVLTTRWF